PSQTGSRSIRTCLVSTSRRPSCLVLVRDHHGAGCPSRRRLTRGRSATCDRKSTADTGSGTQFRPPSTVPPVRKALAAGRFVKRLGRGFKLAVEVDLVEKVVESIIKRIPRPAAELVSRYPERLLPFLFSSSKTHRASFG